MNGQHLNMSQEEFENYCNGLVEINTSTSVLRLIQSNLKILSELKDKQKLLKQESLGLKSEMNSFREEMNTKFLDCLNQNSKKYTQHILNGTDTLGVENKQQKKSYIDDDDGLSSFNSQLMQPLKPSSIALNDSLQPEYAKKLQSINKNDSEQEITQIRLKIDKILELNEIVEDGSGDNGSIKSLEKIGNESNKENINAPIEKTQEKIENS
jgi:hypothetical protein